jgi:hypothetical protein
MKIILYRSGVRILAGLDSGEKAINDVQDAIDLMANAGQSGADGVIVYAFQLAPDFFRLETGLAGEILQKFSNYRMRLAIIGDFAVYKSRSLHNFIIESNKHRHILFVSSLEEALKALEK